MPDSAPSTPLLTIHQGVATLTLNRPAHRNRLEDADLHVLLQALGQLDADPAVRVLVLTANTRASRARCSARVTTLAASTVRRMTRCCSNGSPTRWPRCGR
jgi:1,4-dihydroxy-2-naphthoyl-CoA synthase